MLQIHTPAWTENLGETGEADDDVKEEEIETLYNEKDEKDERKVDNVKKQVMEHLEDIMEARYYVDQLQKELEIDLKEAAAVSPNVAKV